MKDQMPLGRLLYTESEGSGALLACIQSDAINTND